MRVLVPGHRYALANLKGDGETVLQFYRDPEIHGEGWPGPSCQEVIRALIDRVQSLDSEKPCPINHDTIIPALRQALAGFEARALLLKAGKGMPIEQAPVGDDGHLKWEAA